MSAAVKDQDVEDLKRGGLLNLAGTLARALKPVYLAVIANLYGGEIFGQFVLCYAAMELLVGLSVFGSDHGLWNFVSRYREAGSSVMESQALRTGLLWTVGISAFVTLGVWLLVDSVAKYVLSTPGLAHPLRIILPTIPAFALARVLLAATRGLRLMRYHVLVLDFGEMALIFILAPTLYLAGFTQQGVFWALLITALVVLAISIACFFRHFSLRELLSTRAGFISREMVSYNLALGWALVAGLLTRRVDIFMIAHFQPIQIVGAYTLASEFAGSLAKIRSSFSPVVIPVLAAKIARAKESLREPAAFMALSVTALSLPLLLVFVVAGPFLLALYQPEFVGAYGALLVLATAHLLHGLMGPPGEALSVAGLPRFVAIFATVQVALIATLGWLLIPKFGMLGAALASGGALLLSRIPILLIAKGLLGYSSLSPALHSLLIRALVTIGIGGVAAALLRERWPVLAYAVGIVALLTYAWWSWAMIASSLKKKPVAHDRNQESMRFLVFTSEYPPMNTGVASYNRVVAEGLVQRGYAVSVLTFRPFGVRSQQTLANEIRLPVGTQKWLEFSRIILGLIAYRFLAPRYDATLLSSDLAQRIAGDFRLARLKRIVCVIHGSEVTKRFPPRSLLAQAAWHLRLETLQHATRVVAVSRYTRELLSSAGLDRSKIDVIYNGIPSAWYNSKPSAVAVRQLKQNLGISPNEVVLLTLARVVPRKGHDRVLHALQHVLKANRSVRYVIAGTGDHIKQVRRLAEELCLSEHVIFTGEIPEHEKKNYYDMCDVFVMPSLHDGRRVEGLGISFIEAAARRKPCIGGDHGGVPEVIQDGRTGYLIDPDNVEALASRLVMLAADAQLRRQLGEAAYVYAFERFRDTTMVTGIEKLLQAAASNRARR